MKRTYDPHTFIEKHRPGYWRYVQPDTGKRWEVVGVCDQRGDCLIGAVLDDGTLIRDHDHLRQLQQERGKHRILTDLDVPVGPWGNTCCPFEFRILDEGHG